jgi:hypothetical protein
VATILFAARELYRPEGALPSETDVLSSVMQWKQERRPPLNESEVALAVRQLSALGWLDVKPSKDLPVSDPILDAS